MTFRITIIALCWLFAGAAFAQDQILIGKKMPNGTLVTKYNTARLLKEADNVVNPTQGRNVPMSDCSLKTTYDVVTGETIYYLYFTNTKNITSETDVTKLVARLQSPDDNGAIYALSEGIFSETCICRGCTTGCEPTRKNSNWICSDDACGKDRCRKSETIQQNNK